MGSFEHGRVQRGGLVGVGPTKSRVRARDRVTYYKS